MLHYYLNNSCQCVNRLNGLQKKALLGSWLQQYAKNSGDQMPDAKNTFHLPDYHWTDVWARCMRDLKQPISLSAFMTERKKNHKNIKIRKYKKFAQCSECKQLKTKRNEVQSKSNYIFIFILLMQLWRDTVYIIATPEKAFWKARHQQHVRWAEMERAKKTQHEERAVRGDKPSMFIEIDGMDQSKCSMPNPGRYLG